MRLIKLRTQVSLENQLPVRFDSSLRIYFQIFFLYSYFFIHSKLIAWQACVDENTGYSYYWNVETNQVTWEVPADYLTYQTQVQQWKTQQAANSAKFEERNIASSLRLI